VAKSEIVVALHIGTTKICTLAGEVAGEDQVEILGAGIVPSTGMRKGVVVDIPATTAAIRKSVAETERMAGIHIASVYTGITGEHVLSFNNQAGVDVAGEIQEEHVQQARLAAGQVEIPPDREILHCITRQYIVDGQGDVRHPVGMSAGRLEVQSHVVTVATTSRDNLRKCIERAGLEADELIIEPLATGLAVLTDAERQLGVVLADIGGGTTDVALFVDGAITHTAVIPVGGSHVTSDLALGFRLTPEQAEDLKVRYAAARSEDVAPGEFVEIHMIGEAEPREIPRRLLTEITGPRMEELFRLLREHIDRAAADGFHVTQCVLTGGGSQLLGAAELAQRVLEMPVRPGRPREISDPHGLVDSPEYATVVGLLQFAAARSASQRRAKEPRSLTNSALRLLGHWVSRISRRP
jgi:cell division protein FtsA